MRSSREQLIWAVMAVLLVVWAAGGRAAELIKDSDCLDCHNDETLVKTNAAGRAVSLFVNESLLRASVHNTNTCQSCHPDITAKHPDDEVPAKPVDCSRCHERQTLTYADSVHGIA